MVAVAPPVSPRRLAIAVPGLPVLFGITAGFFLDARAARLSACRPFTVIATNPLLRIVNRPLLISSATMPSEGSMRQPLELVPHLFIVAHMSALDRVAIGALRSILVCARVPDRNEG